MAAGVAAIRIELSRIRGCLHFAGGGGVSGCDTSRMPSAVVCDEEPIYAEALGKLLEWQLPELEHVGSVTSTGRLLEMAMAAALRLVVLELEMPSSDVVDTIQHLIAVNPA